MLKFLSQLFKSREQQNTEAKAWLDHLRESELSVNARRVIAPDEPVKAPGIAHGTAEAEAMAPQQLANFERQGRAREKSEATGADYTPDTSIAFEQHASSITFSGEGGNFGGAGSSGSFEGGDSSSSGGDSGSTDGD